MARAVVCITPPFGKIKPLSDLVVFSDVKSYIPEWDTPDYLNACRKYAMKNNVYLVPSRFVVNNILYLCLFSPKGEVLGIQGATHRNLYNQAELSQYDKIEPIQTPIGNIFLCVDVDIYHPQVLRIARMKGAQIVIASQFIDSYQPPHADYRHLERRTVKRRLCRWLLQLFFCGRCSLLSDTGRKRLSGPAGKLPFAVCKVIPQ